MNDCTVSAQDAAEMDAEAMAEVFAAIAASPKFAEITARFNEYVEDCNRTGHVITPAERECLHSIRLSAVCLADPAAMRALSDYLWQSLQTR